MPLTSNSTESSRVNPRTSFGWSVSVSACGAINAGPEFIESFASSHAEFVRRLQRRSAAAADDSRAVSAGQRISNFHRADGTVQGGGLVGCRWCFWSVFQWMSLAVNNQDEDETVTQFITSLGFQRLRERVDLRFPVKTTLPKSCRLIADAQRQTGMSATTRLLPAATYRNVFDTFSDEI